LSEAIEKPKWRWGFKRWIVLLFIILNVFGVIVFPPIRPQVQVQPEELTSPVNLGPLGDFTLTNTLVAMVLVDLIVIALAYFTKRSVMKAEKEHYRMPGGIAGALETLFEYLYNMTQSTAGKWAKTIFPYFASITLVVLIANWMELIPGVDSIGLLHHSTAGNPIKQILPGVFGTVKSGSGETYGVVPFVRTLSTDLNFTVGLAIFSVIMTQVIGLRAQGFKYFTKFWNTRALFKKPFFGLIDWLVGILEIISEFSKILSFSFRLFGNLFAGSILLFVVGALIPVLLQSGILLFEFFIGLIQALIFGMLTMIFMSMATQSYDEEE
jgi:F-type H+-transporting ATPase subunit a